MCILVQESSGSHARIETKRIKKRRIRCLFVYKSSVDSFGISILITKHDELNGPCFNK